VIFFLAVSLSVLFDLLLSLLQEVWKITYYKTHPTQPEGFYGGRELTDSYICLLEGFELVF